MSVADDGGANAQRVAVEMAHVMAQLRTSPEDELFRQIVELTEISMGRVVELGPGMVVGPLSMIALMLSRMCAELSGTSPAEVMADVRDQILAAGDEG